ncbi:hypothetical protein FGF80_00820 [Natrinema pallidum]|uniref:Uncharacterized protein n=1 Tax=Natrinema pallidum TaxID=69527 RepID=A0A4P9TB60_9EURY|nr:hypothetical protein [Natrinema pallidum]QCW01868.1 hypothetical protein FGF80_00820 [Natrinema pallidum]
MVICESCDTAAEPTANYCPECGSELSPTRKDWSDGFLSLVDRGHIQEAIDGNESLPEGYHDRLHETVRHALSDFCLLDRWDDFDNHEALFGDIPEDKIDVDDWEELEKIARLTCPFRFMLNAVDIDRVGTLLELSVLLAVPEAEQPDDVSISIEINAAGD